MLRNIPVIEDAVDGNGFLDVMHGHDGVIRTVQHDGVIRTVQIVLWSEGRAYPSLAFETYRLWFGAERSIVRMRSEGMIESIGFQARNGESVQLPTGLHGEVRPYFTERAASR